MKSGWTGNGFSFLIQNRTKDKRFQLTLVYENLTGLKIEGIPNENDTVEMVVGPKSEKLF